MLSALSEKVGNAIKVPPRSQPTQHSCDIIIPVWNQLKRTQRCLQSVLNHTTGAPYRIILLDNASDQPTASFLEQFSREHRDRVKLIRNDQNFGNIKAVNQGIQASSSDYVCVLDNDTLVFPHWLERMIQLAEQNMEIGIVNPASNDLGLKKPFFLSWDSMARMISKQENGKWVEIATASGFCMLIKRNVINQIGGWDEDFGMGYYEDHDYSRRAYQAGFICAHALDVFVYHERSASFRTVSEVKDMLVQRNRELFESRHGKPKRIAVALKNANKATNDKIGSEILRLARGNHWIWVFLTERCELRKFQVHGFVKASYFPSIFFDWLLLGTAFIKKKRFDEIMIDDARSYDFLSRFYPFCSTKLKLLDKNGLCF